MSQCICKRPLSGWSSEGVFVSGDSLTFVWNCPQHGRRVQEIVARTPSWHWSTAATVNPWRPEQVCEVVRETGAGD